MKDIPDKSVDLIITDLPYATTRNKWDTPIDLEKLWEQYERVMKDNTAVVLFSQQPFTTTLINSNPKMFRYEWIWQKDNATGHLNANRMPLKIHENVLVFYKKLPTYNPQKRAGFKTYTAIKGNDSSNYGKQTETTTVNTDGTRYPIDIIEFKRDKEKLHPTQKPVELCEYLIKTYSHEGGVVLDSTMGVGTTGVACVNTNRKFIGIELDENYFNIAKRRINDVIYKRGDER